MKLKEQIFMKQMLLIKRFKMKELTRNNRKMFKKRVLRNNRKKIKQ